MKNGSSALRFDEFFEAESQHGWWFGVGVTSLGRSTKLLYARPG